MFIVCELFFISPAKTVPGLRVRLLRGNVPIVFSFALPFPSPSFCSPFPSFPSLSQASPPFPSFLLFLKLPPLFPLLSLENRSRPFPGKDGKRERSRFRKFKKYLRGCGSHTFCIFPIFF
jgi:hypothetical protein